MDGVNSRWHGTFEVLHECVKQRFEILGFRTDMLRNGIAGHPVAHAYEPAFGPQAGLNETRIANNDMLQPDEFVRIQISLSCFQDGLAPTPRSIG